MSPTSSKLCRLCLRDDELVNAFDKRLDNGYQLRLCVFLCSGVEIRMTDKVPKVICHNCCSMAIELFKFRQIALANDKSLKDLARQPYKPLPADKDGLQQLQDSIAQRISEAKLSETATKFLEKEEDEQEGGEEEGDEEEGEEEEGSNKRFQYFPDIEVPKEILSENAEDASNADDNSAYDEEEFDGEEEDETENPSDSDDENATIATLKRKYRAAKAAKPNKESEMQSYYFSESDTDSEPIFKRMKHNKYYIDDDYSGCESDNESDYSRSRKKKVVVSEENRKERLRPQRGKQPPTPEAESPSDKQEEKQTGEQKYVSEPYSKYCEYCDRYFWGNSQLKAHQRVHFRCRFCIKGFESQEILQEHLISVCYKTITMNKPSIRLIRVDQNVKLLEMYKAAFDEYFEDIADGIYGDPELIRNPSVKFHLYHTESHRVAERKDIEEIFIKFQHLDNTPVHKNASIQTKRLQTDVAYTNSNQIILDDARKDLRLFDIPIYLVIDRIQSAYISFVKPPRDEKVINKWSPKEILDVSDKSKIGSFYQEETVPEQQRKLPTNKNVTFAAPKPPSMNVGPRKPLHVLGKKAGFEPRVKQFMPRNMAPNVRMSNQGKIIGVARPDQNMIRKPLKPPPNFPVGGNPTGRILYRSPNPNLIGMNAKPPQPNAEIQAKVTNISIPNPKSTEAATKSANNTAPYSKMLQTISNKLNLQQTVSPKTTATSANLNTNPSETNLNVTVNNIIKHVSGSVTIQISKQNPKQQTPSNDSPQSILNISNSVTLEKNQPKQPNHLVQNNVSYPPRPNTAIRNMLESISSEISIEPNYQRQNQNPTNNINNITNRNNNPNINDNINSGIPNNPNTLNNTTPFATPASTTYKPNRITYPRPILIKEEFPPEDTGYNNQSMPEQPLLYNMDYPIKEEHQPENQGYIKSEMSEDTSYSPTVYQNPSQQVNFNAGYSQDPSLQYNPNQPEQYYRPIVRPNLPSVRHRFAVAQPYRNVEYRPTNHTNMYQPRLNQPVSNMAPASTTPMATNVMVPTNSYNTNNYMPNNVYNRPYADNYNNYNNMYQPPFQNQYPPPAYNAQSQPAVDYNNTYTESTAQEPDSKFLRIKQPWELYR